MTQLLFLALSLAVLVVLVRLKVELGLALLAAAAVLGLLAGLAPLALAAGVGRAWWNPDTFNLLGSLLAILVFENILRKQGYLRRVLSSLRAIFADYRVVMALCPAFLGLLPSAGGALLSAPMVEEAAAGRKISPEQKTLVNYWYRHVWEYSLPLYPGIILAAKLVKIPITRLIVPLFPFTVFAALLGILVVMRTLPKDKEEKSPIPKARRRGLLDLLHGAAPVALVILAVLLAGLEVWTAVLAVCLALLILHRYNGHMLAELTKEAFSLRTILLVAGIMAFRGILETAGFVESLPNLFAQLGLPPVAVIILIPMVLGLLLGLSQGFVGAGFPLILGLIGTAAQAHVGLAVLAFVAGFTGVMLTPLHFCLALTLQYFKAGLGPVWRRVAPAMMAVLAVAVGYGVWVVK